MCKKVNVRSLFVAVAAAAILGVSSVQAESLKIGYVDVNSAMQNTTSYQQSMKRLKSLQEQKVKELVAQREKIDKVEKDLLGQSMAMSPERLSQNQQELKEMRKTLQRGQQDAQEVVSNEQTRLQRSFGEKFEAVMRGYGKKNGYDMIMPKPMFLYVDPKHDVTADITKLLDAKK